MSRLIVALGAVVAALLLMVGGVLAYLLPAGGSPQPGTAAGQPPAVLAQTAQPAATRSITVIADGSASARPDQAWISVGVQASRPTAAEALDESSQATEAVLAKLDELGIPRTNVQTSGLSLFPVYDEGPRTEPGTEPQLTGYRAHNQLTILVDDLGTVGQVLDSVVAAGANTVDGVRFGLKDDSALRTQALQAAVQAARPKAETIANSLNLALGEVIEVREQGAFSPVPGGMGAVEQKASVPIEGGQLSVRSQVQVTFALAPAAP